MQIGNNLNKCNFGAKPIFNINLRKAGDTGYSSIPARFSELSPYDETDCTAVNNLTRDWRDYIWSSNFIYNIASTFHSKSPKYKLYATETDAIGNGTLASKITSVIQTTNPQSKDKDIFEIVCIQSSPDIADRRIPVIKGSGELAMYGAVKLADKEGFDRVEARSFNHGFYEKIGFHRVDYFNTENYFKSATTYYVLPKESYNKFLNAVEKKYNLKPDEVDNILIKENNKKTCAD